MNIERFLEEIGSSFYTGVPDSQLRPLCDCLMDIYGIDPQHHIIAANEGSCAALAAGYHLATGKVPVVYMQNSGEGNIINPAASLLSDRVYGIPVVFIIGWRGEPGVHDEPQHLYQGEVTLKLLEDMDIRAYVVGAETSIEEVQTAMEDIRPRLAAGKSAAFVIRKGALTYDRELVYPNGHTIRREEAIQRIVYAAGTDPVVSTTGKASRELFEIRERGGQSHRYDFLTVGSMGHASSIALGLALHKPDRRIWCIDGDGAVLMHMGALAVIGATKPENMVHTVINNGAHETVGGMPTVAGQLNLSAIAKACGYPCAVCVDTVDALNAALRDVSKRRGPVFLEILCANGARENLGRPAAAPQENKQAFMDYLKECEPT